MATDRPDSAARPRAAETVPPPLGAYTGQQRAWAGALQQRAAAAREDARRTRTANTLRRMRDALHSTSPVLAVGSLTPVDGLLGDEHVIDGDGSSLCGLVPASLLTPVDGITWADLPEPARCQLCAAQL